MGNRALARLLEETRTAPASPELRRKCACGGKSEEGEFAECRQKQLARRRDAAGEDAGSEAPSIVEEVLRTPGQPLADSARKTLETGFGHDFSQVRIHDDSKAAESASAVNALAYTVGSHIVFGKGQYSPGTSEGTRLLAHELTHTIQQTGSMPFGGLLSSIQRDEDKKAGSEDKDKAWATDIRAKVQAVQDAAQAAGDTLNADVALQALKGAQSSYLSFEAAYNEAVGRFTKGVKKAMEAAEELRKNVKAVASLALAEFGPEAETVSKAAEKVLKQVETAKEFIGEVAATEEQKPDIKPGPTDQTDWKALLETTIDSYDKYIKGNKSISAITKACLANVKWLDTVVDGKGGDNARTSAEGQKADKFGEGSAKAVAQLGTIQKGAVSSGATEFAKNVSEALDHQTAEKIEQDIAIKWLSGLSREDVGAIGDAGEYLKQIGVIDSKGNRLGVDTGIWTFEWDTIVIRARAQAEQRAKEMVGTSRQWGGGKTIGGAVRGSVRGDEKSSNWWSATGPTTLKEEAVGEVRIVSYSIAAIDKDVSSNWEHVNESQLGDRMIAKVTLAVEPFGESKRAGGGEPELGQTDT